MPEGYKYDVFISYLHTDPSGEEAATYTWVLEYFYPALKLWLPHYVPPGYHTHLYMDKTNIKVGSDWPHDLQQALQTSRCLLAVFSSQYFGSQWCQAELKTMLAREKSLGLRTRKNPSSLIYPVVFSGEEYIPKAVKTIQRKDFSPFACAHSNFKNSPKYEKFEDAIKEICRDLSKMFLDAPIWDKDWPVVIPKQPIRKIAKIPRL